MADTSSLPRMIAAQNWQAVETARTLGPAAVAAIAPQVSAQDAEVRFLAVRCVIAAGGPDAPALLVRASGDSDEQIRTTAAKALVDLPPKGLEQQALAVWTANTDSTVRYYLALAVGMAANPSMVQPLEDRLRLLPPTEPVSTSDSLVAALSRLADSPGQLKLKELMEKAGGPRAAVVLELFKYVDDARLLKYLRPLADRREEAVDLSNHAVVFKRRTCDLAIDELLRQAPGKLSYKADPAKRYSDDQIAEAVKYLDGLP